MTAEQLYQALGDLEDRHISDAEALPTAPAVPGWLRWSAAACIVLLIAVGVSLPLVRNQPLSPTAPPLETTGAALEETSIALGIGEQYRYWVSSGPYSTYQSGKVIDGKLLGAKLEEVTVKGGWFYGADGSQFTGETLRAEVYEIRDVPHTTAVALRFLDQGAALTTTHYYVIMNPEADLSPVEDYVIPTTVYNGDE